VFFHNHESEPTTEVAIRRSPAEDLYIHARRLRSGRGERDAQGRGEPVVDWIWFGFMLLAIGTAISLIPDSVLDRLTMRVPARDDAGAASGSGVAGLLIWIAVGAAAAGLIPGAGERVAQAQGQARAPEMAATNAELPSPEGVDENWLVRTSCASAAPAATA